MTTTAEPTKGVPRIENNPSPTFRADHNALADWVRDNTDRTAPTEADLPKTGNWPNRRIFVLDTALVYTWFSAARGWVRQNTVQILNGSNYGAAGAINPPADAVFREYHFHAEPNLNASGVGNIVFPIALPNRCAFIHMQTESGAGTNPVVNAGQFSRTGATIVIPGNGAGDVRISVHIGGW